MSRILVVDDDPIQRALLSESLGLAGFEVVEAEDGPIALDRATRESPDLVLLDVQMPGMSGFEVVRKLRGLPRLGDTPVLFVSSVDTEQAKVHGFDQGADDYIVKPWAQAELLARVRAGLRRADRGAARAGAGMSGAVEDVGIDTIVQTVELSGRAARVRLLDVDAELVLGRGLLFSCRFKRFEGHEALQRIWLIGRGRFSVEFVTTADLARDVAGDVAAGHAFMDACVAVDEARRLLAAAAAGNPLLHGRPEGAALGSLRDDLPMTALDAAATLPGDVRETTRLVVEAMGVGALRVVDEGRGPR